MFATGITTGVAHVALPHASDEASNVGGVNGLNIVADMESLGHLVACPYSERK